MSIYSNSICKLAARIRAGVVLVGVCLLATASFDASNTAQADTVRLVNGDSIRGNVVSLTHETLTLASENFGEMAIPRAKVQIIGLGDEPLEKVLGVPTVNGTVSATSGNPVSDMPSMQNPQVKAQVEGMLQSALGGVGGLGDLQKNAAETRRGLEDLKKDLGPGPSADALDSYIKIFELFGGGTASPAAPQPSSTK